MNTSLRQPISVDDAEHMYARGERRLSALAVEVASYQDAGLPVPADTLSLYTSATSRFAEWCDEWGFDASAVDDASATMH